MKTLIIDNFDSFTYNLYQYVAELGGNPEVFRNNEISLPQIERDGYTHIIISPGPGTPENKKDFGVCGDVIKRFKGRIPILGVCLGHQGIIHVLGGRIVRTKPMHGKRSMMRLNTAHPLFKGLPEKIEGMRYHSLIGEKKSLPRDLEIIAETLDDKIIMGVTHKSLPLYGVQFHPESIGTKNGKKILKNFLEIKESSDSMSEKEAEHVLDKMASGKMSADDMKKLLVGLADKGESVSEIVGMARGMRKRAIPVNVDEFALMDTCGTGGSGLKRMNISTTAAFVLAACGVKIAKHGNRAASGRSGSFDLLEALGVTIALPPKAVEQAIREVGIGFIFAPMFHPAMKYIAPVRRALGRRTIFNLLGPLTNPARASYHLLGATKPEIAEKMIEAMKDLNYTHAMVVAGSDGLDDITLNGTTKIYELDRGSVREFEFSPKEVGMEPVKNFKEISGGSAEQNAKIFLQLLHGKGPRAMQNLLYLNVAFALVVREIAQTVAQGIEMAKHIISSGAAYEKFQEYKRFSCFYRPFHNAIRGKKHIKVIAEIKRKSPSFGKFPLVDVSKFVHAYEKGGAAALSVVTCPKRFDGSIELLQKMRAETERPGGKKLPIIRKDFIKTTKQIDETVAAGASAVLLIARDLKKIQLARLVEYAHKKGLDTVVEIHNDSDLKKLNFLKNTKNFACGEVIVGINNRDLGTFKTSVNHAESLLKLINPDQTVIVESGFSNAHELAQYRGKADAVLIGTSLLASKNPYAKLRTFTRI